MVRRKSPTNRRREYPDVESIGSYAEIFILSYEGMTKTRICVKCKIGRIACPHFDSIPYPFYADCTDTVESSP